MKSTKIFVVAAALVTLLASAALAQVPDTMTFTGRIADTSGPVSGAVNLNFKIFDSAAAGTMLWEETPSGVTADNGLAYVLLGQGVGNGLNDGTIFDGTTRYLEVTVNGDIMSPRVAIASVPYAVRSSAAETATSAATADTLGSLAPSDVALSTHDHAGVYALDAHTHSNYSLTTHNHTGVYAAVAHTHSNYSLTTHNHTGVYAPAAHAHSALDITSGTLSTNRYDAYNDLSVSGRIGVDPTDLATIAAGDARWDGVLNYGFFAYNSADDATTVTGWSKIENNAELLDIGAVYNVSLDRFVAPVTGVYHFSGNVGFSNADAGNRYVVGLYRNGTGYVALSSGYTVGTANFQVFGGSATIPLTAGQYVELWAFTSDSTTTYEGGSGTAAYTNFSGHIVY